MHEYGAICLSRGCDKHTGARRPADGPRARVGTVDRSAAEVQARAAARFSDVREEPANIAACTRFRGLACRGIRKNAWDGENGSRAADRIIAVAGARFDSRRRAHTALLIGEFHA